MSSPLPAPPFVTSILADLEAGEPPILLADLRDEPYMPRHGGRKLDKSVPFRWASRGSAGIRLEAIATPTGKATTRAAVLRFFAALTKTDKPSLPAPTPKRRRAEIERAHRELTAAGI